MNKRINIICKIVLLIAISTIAESCSSLSDISSSLIELDVSYDDTQIPKDVGEIYCYPINEEHVSSINDAINFIDNEILIVVDPKIDKNTVDDLAQKYGGEVVGYIEKTGDYQILLNKVHSFDDINSLVDDISNEDIVISAGLNYTAAVSDNTINYGDKWRNDLKNDGDFKGKSWAIEAIRVPAAWKLLEENSDKVNTTLRIGVIDSGFDMGHEDLKEAFAETFPNYNKNIAEHGTHVAGTMAALSDNSIGICGVYPYSRGHLYGISTRGIAGYSENKTYWTSVMVEKIALSELILRNVKVINQSQGFNWYQFEKINTGKDEFTSWWDNFEGGEFSTYKAESDLIGDFLNRLLYKGYEFTVVCAAGNDSDYGTHHLESEYSSWLALIDEEKYPRVYNRIIVVGSVDKKYNISSFSNTGERVDIYAPGENIYSTVPNNKYSNSGWSGTSMASPHVTGVAAMVWAADSKLTGEQVKTIVCNSVSYESHNAKMVDAKIAVMAALKISEKNGESMPKPNEASYGSIMSYIVNKSDENIRINEAHITAESISDGSVYDVFSDNSGHFELILPDGKYKISILADGYETYSYFDEIQCTSQQVNYIDWAKLTENDRKNIKHAEDFYGWTIQKVKNYFGADQCEEYTLLHGNEGLYVPKKECVFIKGRVIDTLTGDSIVDGIAVLKNGEIFDGAIIGSSAKNATENTHGRFNINMIQVSDVNGNYIYVDSSDSRMTYYIDMNEGPTSESDLPNNHIDSMELSSGLVKYSYDNDNQVNSFSITSGSANKETSSTYDNNFTKSENQIAKAIFTNAATFCIKCEVNGEPVKDGYYRIDFSKNTIFSKENVPCHSEFLSDFLIVMSQYHDLNENNYRNGYGFLRINNNVPEYVYYTSSNPKEKSDYQIGVCPKQNVEKFQPDLFNETVTLIDQSTLDNLALEIYSLSSEAFDSLSIVDQSSLCLGAAKFKDILELSGYSTDKFQSQFLKKYALEPWMSIKIKINFHSENAKVQDFYIDYVSISFDDNLAYVKEQGNSLGTYSKSQ